MLIRFVEKQPKTAWERANPQEYGFYSNVNPPSTLRAGRREGTPHPRLLRQPQDGDFYGYGEQVASLYAGMDLTKSD